MTPPADVDDDFYGYYDDDDYDDDQDRLVWDPVLGRYVYANGDY